jgi:hypothetical protein
MSPPDAKPTQKTQPKKGKPVEIPVPKVSTIRAAIRKVAQPVKPDRSK